jgi:tRNA 2-thiouridine synthesizing protein E
LFPAGYHRGACRLAGLNYFDNYDLRGDMKKVYHVNVWGFLVDPAEWDEAYANTRAYEFGIELSEQHWRTIRFVRAYFEQHKKIPNIFEVCKVCEVDDLEKLFPTGYHRGVLKIAGLCLK